MKTRVRFAPSPTGYLHIGSLRTALYNFLYAKGQGGTFILRVEDTDRTRLVEGALEEQIESLAWAGVVFDEGPHVGGDYGPYVQSERFHLYGEYGMKLIENGTAYYAFDTAEEIDAMRQRQQAAGIAPKYDRSSMRNQYTLGEQETTRLLAENAEHVVRLKVPIATDVRFTDAIRGDVVVNSKDIDDQILIKSDGFPTYHLANIVDDHLMEISHVIRAEEWLPSAPKHVLLYQAFGWEPPIFAHVPLLLNPDRSKMSKRHGDTHVKDFRAKGYFPEALVNFVALLGWNPGTDQEIFSMQELIHNFSLERVHKAGAVFDYKKLDWLNSEYIKTMPPAILAERILPELQKARYPRIELPFVAEVITLLRERITFLQDIVEFGDYLFSDNLAEVPAEVTTTITENTAVVSALKAFAEGLTDQSIATADDFKAYATGVSASAEIKMGAIMKPLRLAVTHRDVGADLHQTILLIGVDKCRSRITSFLS